MFIVERAIGRRRRYNKRNRENKSKGNSMHGGPARSCVQSLGNNLRKSRRVS